MIGRQFISMEELKLADLADKRASSRAPAPVKSRQHEEEEKRDASVETYSAAEFLWVRARVRNATESSYRYVLYLGYLREEFREAVETVFI